MRADHTDLSGAFMQSTARIVRSGPDGPGGKVTIRTTRPKTSPPDVLPVPVYSTIPAVNPATAPTTSTAGGFTAAASASAAMLASVPRTVR